MVLSTTAIVAQSNSSVSQEKVTSTNDLKKSNVQSISNNFNTLTIASYQQQSQNKIKEFFEYLNEYAQTTDEALSKELEKVLLQSLQNENLGFTNILNPAATKVSFATLLETVKKNNLRFSLFSFNTIKTQQSYFECEYSLQISQMDEVKQTKLTQKVYLYPYEKKFGQMQKQVWELKLGDF